jgi:DNA-binding transcriptional ArsR family regulator
LPDHHMPEKYMPEPNAPSSKVPERTGNPRRRRYARSAFPASCASLTPVRLEILRFLAELRFLSLPQIAKLCCPSPRQDLSEKSARRHMRALFDARLVDVLPVSRAALAPPGAPNDASLLYGSAPNVYAPAARGLETLHRAGLADSQAAGRKKPAYGPKNSVFLAHELAVRDVRVWLELAAREGGHELECWQDGEAAVISLDRQQAPFAVRPDAWFVLRLERAVLVGLVEVDRGTERGERHWREKLDGFGALFAGGRLPAVTGYVNARVLVIAPNARRRDQLAELIGTCAEAALAQRFWLASREGMEQPDVTQWFWKQPGNQKLQPLVPATLLRDE